MIASSFRVAATPAKSPVLEKIWIVLKVTLAAPMANGCAALGLRESILVETKASLPAHSVLLARSHR